MTPENQPHWPPDQGSWLVRAAPVKDAKGKIIGAIEVAHDITERKKAEEALVKLEIARKQEIHHRIKNNLQVISSLLDLQAETFNGKECIRDSEVLEAFRNSQDRVISMALIHEELYRGKGFKGEGFESEGFELLNFSMYIKELADNLLKTYSIGNTDTCLNMDLMENAFFDMDTAVPLGIIINELVSNSLKHAFKGRDRGEIQIKLQREDSEDCSSTFVLSVSDNGIGIPEDIEIEDLDSLGLQLVTSLVDQLDGELELRRDNGTEFIIRFMVIENKNYESVPTTQQSV
jgi:two-component sensor histidine kinase